jgi:hypothetical protein
MRTEQRIRRSRCRGAVGLALLALLWVGPAHAVSTTPATVHADARMTLDRAGPTPVAGSVFLLAVGVESIPLTAGAAFEFTTTIELPDGVAFVSSGRGAPTSFVCVPAGQTITCRSRHIGGDLSTNVNLSLRAPRAGSYTFRATVAIDGQPDTDPANNATELTLMVAQAPQARQCTVPNLSGRALPAARSAIIAAGCRLGVTRTVRSATVKKGRVIRQAPRAGVRVPRARSITVVVSRGR